MSERSHGDDWQAGDSYDAYMGRWSRQIAPLFIEWLRPMAGLEWLDVGCGTGALTGAILARCDPVRITAIHPSGSFLARARAAFADERVGFRLGDAEMLP